jgi:hypothetical protein
MLKVVAQIWGQPPSRAAKRRAARLSPRRRGSVLLMTLVYSMMFAALASSMVAFSMGNMQVERAETDSARALAAAESGMSFLMLQYRLVNLPSITEGSIASMSTPANLWSGTNVEGISGNSGIAVALAAAINGSGAYSNSPVTAPTGTNPLVAPPIKVDPSGDGSTFSLNVSWDPANPKLVAGTNTSIVILHCTSLGASGRATRTVMMDVWIQKTLKYAVYSNVAIQLGKNVRVIGDIASTYAGTNKGPPVQMFSDFHYLPNMSSLDNDLATLRGLLNTYDTTYANRLDVRNPNSAAAKAAAAAGFSDTNGDGYIDDYDIALMHINPSWSKTNLSSNGMTSGQFINPNTGQSYDADLFSEIDSPMGAVNSATGLLPNGSSPPWNGYGDNTINNLDNYAKVTGTVKTALTYGQWTSAASSWQQWGDTSGGTAGTSFRDQFEGSVIPTDPTVSPVQFGTDFGNEQTLTPQNFDTSNYDNQIPSTTATVATSGGTTTISNGTLTAAMANGGTATEHSPYDATSGWQATYSRPVFQNINFNNVRIPKGLNAKFVNCTFSGYTSVKLNTNITQAGTNTTTSDPSQGMTWAQQMVAGQGSFSANTTLTSTNSVAYQQGNNLHFTGCTFNGVMTSDVPTAYTHFADSWEFDGTTAFNNQVDQSVTIEAPNTNIEMGSYVNPSGNPSTLVGVVVAGNIDIRGTANVDGSLLVTGAGATNTTLGYFGSTDQGQAVPPASQLPSGSNGSYGHLFFQFNPGRGMPNGITIPVVALPQNNTYQIR